MFYAEPLFFLLMKGRYIAILYIMRPRKGVFLLILHCSHCFVDISLVNYRRDQILKKLRATTYESIQESSKDIPTYSYIIDYFHIDHFNLVNCLAQYVPACLSQPYQCILTEIA
jgi:hypothetical protein